MQPGQQGPGKSEQIIDTLFAPLKGMQRKSRTYRQKARRLYVYQVKNRKRIALEITAVFAKKHKILISEPPLGRVPKQTEENGEEIKARRRRQHWDELDRIPVEGKFGQAKRRFGLECIMARLSNSSATVIAITFMVMNPAKWLHKLFFVPLFLTCSSMLKQLRRPICLHDGVA